MMISYNWLKKYLDLPTGTTPEEVGARLKASTVEVESINNLGSGLDGIVVGKVISAEKHANADKLKVCTVDVGGEKLQIVCGGSNVVAGMLVAVAKLGARVKWHGEGEPIVMEKAKIRGVESFGMICASTEIGLGEMFPPKEEKEILDLSPLPLAAPPQGGGDNIPASLRRGERGGVAVGTPLVQALGLNDAIFEIDNKSLSHRPDLWGHYGIAREVAVLFNVELKPYPTKKITAGKKVKLSVAVEDKKLCPRYMGVAVSGVKVAESPEWIKQALLAVGQRPINNVVDITNYVMLDLGEPMHAFDARNVQGGIVVRTAGKQQSFIALDGQENILLANDLVIADANKILAIAGIKGGRESGIASDTETVIFEAANFNSIAVRKTANRLGLRTDSAMRFEKSLDPNMCALAIARAVDLLIECCPGALVASAVVDKSSFTLPVGPITVAPDAFSKKLGVHIPTDQIKNILQRLGLILKIKKDVWAVTIPTWRATKDISIVEDLAEEVARFFGYDNIPATMPSFPIAPPIANELRQLERAIKNIMAGGLGFTEVYNYSFVSQTQIDNMGDDASKYIELANPLSKERPYLRRSLLSNLLENYKNNIANLDELSIFEVGKVYRAELAGPRVKINSDRLLPKQDNWLAALCGGKTDVTPYWQARRAVETILTELNLEWQAVAPEKIQPWEHPYRLFLIQVAGHIVGAAGELHRTVTGNYGLDGLVAFVQLNLDELVLIAGKAESIRSYTPVSIYPEVTRDLALVVTKDISYAAMAKVLTSVDALIKKVELFDVYEGKGVGAGYKSMAWRLTYARPDRTLTAAEVETVESKVIKLAKDQFNAEVR
ncbi:MAG: phenylalanine--tRNA ligase subunit beta [bacterium]|nr:phenylalanine--tRNA ligase subunit beta [bacterium]